MNGGTNIAASLQKAGQLLKKHVLPDGTRVVVLLTGVLHHNCDLLC